MYGTVNERKQNERKNYWESSKEMKNERGEGGERGTEANK